MKYMTASQAARKWNISQRRVQVLCSEGRIEGVFKLGDNWAIPENSEKPKEISALLFLFLNLTTQHADPIVKHNHIVGEVELCKA